MEAFMAGLMISAVVVGALDIRHYSRVVGEMRKHLDDLERRFRQLESPHPKHDFCDGLDDIR
jgi:hypothetical protein